MTIGESYRANVENAAFVTFAPWQNTAGPAQTQTTVITVFTIWEIHDVLNKAVLKDFRGSFFLVNLRDLRHRVQSGGIVLMTVDEEARLLLST